MREEILGRDEILGREEILGHDEILGSYLPAVIRSGKFKRRRGKGVWGKLAKAATVPLQALSQRGVMMRGIEEILGRDEILGEGFVGDDERALAAEGGSAERESLARRTTSGYNSKWAHMRGNARIKHSSSSSGAAPIVDGLPHPNPLTAEQKEDIRVYLRHLPAMRPSQVADHERMVAQLREKFGEVKERALAGDGRSLERWRDIVKWVNKLQEGALRNDQNALTHLRNISRAGIFNPRFRVAGERPSWEYADELGARGSSRGRHGGPRRKHRKYHRDPVQKKDKYGRVRTLYRWRDGSLNVLPEPLD